MTAQQWAKKLNELEASAKLASQQIAIARDEGMKVIGKTEVGRNIIAQLEVYNDGLGVRIDGEHHSHKQTIALRDVLLEWFPVNETVSLPLSGWKKHIATSYHHTVHRRCHHCLKNRTIEELVADLETGGAVIQSVTGRVFCAPGCFDAYKEAEGL